MKAGSIFRNSLTQPNYQSWARFGSQTEPNRTEPNRSVRFTTFQTELGFGSVRFATFRFRFGSVPRKREPNPSKNRFSMHFSAYFKFRFGSVRIGSQIIRFGSVRRFRKKSSVRFGSV